MFMEINKGQKAITKESATHRFKEDEIIEFVKNGDSSQQENYYDYIFTNGEINQYLLEDDFKLLDN